MTGKKGAKHKDKKKFDDCYIIDPSGCYIWIGSILKRHGRTTYGQFWDENGVRWYAHIYAYVRKYGPVPYGKILHHSCERKRCCNPDHVSPKTHQENLLIGNASSPRAGRTF